VTARAHRNSNGASSRRSEDFDRAQLRAPALAFRAFSLSRGLTGLRVRIRPRPWVAADRKSCFTIRSSKEWNEITTRRHRGGSSQEAGDSLSELVEFIVHGDPDRLERAVAG